MLKLRTTLELSAGARGADEYYLDVEIIYSVYVGCEATSVSPAEDPVVIFKSIFVIDDEGQRHPANWLIAVLEEDEELLRQCLAGWEEDQAAAEEYRAESRREALRWETGQ